MATGTAGGLLTDQKATSVFKHEILRQYMTAYFAKVSSSSPGHRVMVVDGFAGRGTFQDGTPGSAALFMDAAVGLLPKTNTRVRLFEQNQQDAAHLATVAALYRQRGLDVESECSDINARLQQTVGEGKGIPLFLFLDPCGQNVPFELLADLLTTTRKALKPSTEVLLNLSADFTRRIGGTLGAGHTNAKGLLTMDRMVGGDWWRKLALSTHASTSDGSWGKAADEVASEYTRRLCQATGMVGVAVPVRRKPVHQATYHLVFLTRSNEGLWLMANSLAKARIRWLEATGPQDDDEQDGLFAMDPIAEKVDAEQHAAAKAARQRVLGIAAKRGRFRLVDHVAEVFGVDYGLMTESTITKVMAGLKSDKVVDREPGKKIQQAWFTDRRQT